MRDGDGMSKVLALMGSPRKNKNTDRALEAMLTGMREKGHEVKKINIIDKDISPCVGCGYCEKEGECVIKDDMDEIYEGFDNSNIFVIASPLYFNTVSSFMKKVIDRCQKVWAFKCNHNDTKYKGKDKKMGIFIGVGGADFYHDQFSAMVTTMDLVFKVIDAKYIGNYFISGTDKKNVSDRSDVMDELYNIGKNIDRQESFYLYR